MAGTKLNNTKERLIEAAEILYTTTYVRAWAGCQNGEAVGKIIAEETAFHAEEREDGMTAGDLGMLVYDIHHGKVTVDIVDEPLCLGLADGLFGARPRFPRWLNPKFMAMLATGEDWIDDLPNQTFSAELTSRMKTGSD